MKSKKTQCIEMLAAELFLYKKNSKINNAYFYQNYPFSKGTVYSALNFLMANKAIAIKNKTILGSYISKINYSKLFEFTKHKKIICVLPIPTTLNFKVMSSTLEHVFAKYNIPIEIIYKPGGLKRAELIENGIAQIALVSKLAATEFAEKNPKISLIQELGFQSWTKSYAVVFSKAKYKKITNGMTIGLDKNSIDSLILTKALVGKKKVEFVNKKYYTLLDEIQNKNIDALVHNTENIAQNIGYIVPITSLISNKQLLFSSNIATIISNTNDLVLKNIFKNLITETKLLEAMEKVKENPSLMNY